MYEAILSALLALPVCYVDREWSGKRAQLEQIAQVIAVVSAPAKRPESRAAELVTVGYWESRFCLHVQERARRAAGNGYWQLETYMGWVTGDDPQALYMGAWNAALALQRSHHCGHFPEEVFTAYAGRPCRDAAYGWPTSHDREQTYYYVYGRITKWKQEND